MSTSQVSTVNAVAMAPKPAEITLPIVPAIGASWKKIDSKTANIEIAADTSSMARGTDGKLRAQTDFSFVDPLDSSNWIANAAAYVLDSSALAQQVVGAPEVTEAALKMALSQLPGGSKSIKVGAGVDVTLTDRGLVINYGKGRQIAISQSATDPSKMAIGYFKEGKMQSMELGNGSTFLKIPSAGDASTPVTLGVTTDKSGIAKLQIDNGFGTLMNFDRTNTASKYDASYSTSGAQKLDIPANSKIINFRSNGDVAVTTPYVQQVNVFDNAISGILRNGKTPVATMSSAQK